jgi:hypothetical protein
MPALLLPFFVYFAPLIVEAETALNRSACKQPILKNEKDRRPSLLPGPGMPEFCTNVPPQLFS